jgi:hypothetical protein
VFIGTTNSLLIDVHPELLPMPDGSVSATPPATVSLKPGTNYVAIDLFDRQLHVLSRAIHQGAVSIGRLIANTNGLVEAQPFPAIPPLTAIPQTKSLIAAHEDIYPVLIGDSLTEGAGVADYHDTWPFLVFQPTATTNTWSLLTDVPHLHVLQMGVGGLSAEYGLVTVTEGSSRVSGTHRVAIVGFGANTTLGDAPLVEALVQRLRLSGIEVVLQTGESRPDGKPTPFLDDAEALSGIAERQDVRWQIPMPTCLNEMAHIRRTRSTLPRSGIRYGPAASVRF